MTSGKQTIINEVPLKQIEDILTTFTQVNVRVKRNTTKGQWATIFSNRMLDTEQLAQMEAVIAEYQCGGGKFTGVTQAPEDHYYLSLNYTF